MASNDFPPLASAQRTAGVAAFVAGSFLFCCPQLFLDSWEPLLIFSPMAFFASLLVYLAVRWLLPPALVPSAKYKDGTTSFALSCLQWVAPPLALTSGYLAVLVTLYLYETGIFIRSTATLAALTVSLGCLYCFFKTTQSSWLRMKLICGHLTMVICLCLLADLLMLFGMPPAGKMIAPLAAVQRFLGPPACLGLAVWHLLRVNAALHKMTYDDDKKPSEGPT